MSTNDFTGWAIRRSGSCVGEVDCGVTVDPFHACCPSSTACPSQYNVACCPFGTNCTAAAVETPKCANGSWAMFDNAGFFCCEQGYIGYNYRGSDGCSKSGASLPDGALPLAEISQVSFTSSSTTSTAPTATPTASATSDSQSNSDSNFGSNNSAPVGAIVGGVVGGVAFLALVILCLWFVRRRKARLEDASQSFMLNQEPPVPIRTEKYAATVTPGQVEIDGNPRAELSNDAATKTYELA
ncbi:hypothetical protein F5Y00DRAFT_228985 [Daldinia vernicosa]|uniref:uncharacterized protein n=1 Tax=Daldinia vernicosa TaxID=114800 RepID=UPI0020086D6C|nr:uncharacterized protein F5Y00DRAFT_228985 [Daldinia vernicosa]KAI0851689.1 hypothetical protein F5Y00DRAFT_228985 [Daldinia vernicosa]